MLFDKAYILWLLILALPLFYLAKDLSSPLNRVFNKEILKKISPNKNSLSQRARVVILIFSFIFAIVALARPQIDNGEIKVKTQSKNLVVAIDISKSMFLTDIYPNRFEFAKAKFKKLLSNLKETKIALLGFSDRAFLVAPLTSDYGSLRYLANHLRADYLNLKGTSIMQALNSANDLTKNSKQKALLIFSDGGDKSDFSKEIAYAKQNNIKVFIYATATKKGALIKDNNGNLFNSKLNSNIKELALKSGGAYMEASLNSNDMKELADIIERSLKAQKESQDVIKDRVELFYYPLTISVILLFIGLFSLPQRKIA
jgi:Ca-activated chloride channel family protein